MSTTTHPQDRLGVRIAVMNNKGGVGKTTVTREIGFALARQGRSVLLVDMDPQGNLTGRCGITLDDGQLTIAEILARPSKGDAAKAIVPVGWDLPAGLVDIIPADLALEDRTHEESVSGSGMRLTRALHGVTDNYDVTLIDCRPALGHLELMVASCLEESDGVLIVVEPGRDSISGAARVMRVVDDWTDRLEQPTRVLGVVVNLYDARTKLHRDRVTTMAESLTGIERMYEHPDPLPTPPILTPRLPVATRIAQLQDSAALSTGDVRLDREGLLDRFDALAEQLLDQVS